MIESILLQIWLNENEVKIYLASLELWNTHAGRIIKHTWLARATVYDGLERLVKKWLISKYAKSGSTIFSPEEPEKLEYMIDGQYKKIKKIKDNMDSVLPHLKKLKNPFIWMPKVRMYEWKEWIKSVFDDSLTAKEVVYTYVNVYDMELYINQEMHSEYIKKRKELKISKKWLLIDTPFARKHYENYDKSVSEARFLKKEIMPFHIEMNIYDSKISYVTYRDKNPIWVIIEDEDIYKIHRSTFELLWQQSEIIK
ncbi:MAG: transcriptional regulator, TrmB [uncultured bacterium (gcode 4)]|uniref:Transcriptional regulator, TrmB n=1 Tax=uncultured bacterium (gcode 4) TaxID=1234023 RepID=K2FYA1_9BACT|nr:MAG: transcriptional regulator, TrmB [uncultured bacterium (gcode 4)]